MQFKTGFGLLVALASALLTNVAYLREHNAAAALPVLSMRRPLYSLELLVEDRPWLTGFAMETAGFLLYAAALALAPLALVQSIGAGGIGILAFISVRIDHRSLSRRKLTGVVLSVVGLLLLAVSLAGGSGNGTGGSIQEILLWLGTSAALALAVLAIGRSRRITAVTNGIAGGILFSIGDISTKMVTQGGARVAFLLTVLVGYATGTGLIQEGYQAGGALTVAGLATLLTNALPIAAGPVVLHEEVPSGALGVVRLLAFATVTVGAVILASPGKTYDKSKGTH